ncbi:MAG: hypothetical protein COY66_05035 [Candidatus Kerfeldbacteria bacterium CG_4_10_14_0_8_um_filter_42_10]|uniref:Uncharacterized protein n=1 Tax=Candidatus Kerfeldbacteria bacterium CG_4_10_14_0_8_um_filter_42_10 TaxID=2014248 RepID=A0A2M7RH68_9BACT|nr:MAG: hypothetical protein COY66_05035 [Candidatus Kerfeldbacteria bacterium CG_4_10_14_0_8_um_filter_42_10]
MKQPVLIDHKNLVVYYNPEDLTSLSVIGEIVEFWGNTPPFYAVAKYEGEDMRIQIEKINIKRAETMDKDKKIADLEARIKILEDKNKV